MVWTCWQSSQQQWQMFQPIQHYQSGHYPNWNDCLAWRNGEPAEPYTWSYGLVGISTTTQTTSTTLVETTTTESTTTSTSTSVPTTEETWVTTTVSTTTIPTSTTGVPTTTVPAETTTSSTTTTTVQVWVPPATTTTEMTTTTTTTTTTTVPETSTSSSTTTSQPETTTIASTTTSQPKPSTTTTTLVATTVEPASTTTVPVPKELPYMSLVQQLDFSSAEQVFSDISEQQLSDEQITAIIDAVQEAPAEVRQAFETNVDVFGQGFDDYVPLGSEIPVHSRRTLIAVAAGAGLSAMGASRRNKSE